MFNCMGKSYWCSPNQVALSIRIHERHTRAPGPIFMLDGRCDLRAKESSSLLCRKKSIVIQAQWLFVYLATGQKNSITYWAPVWLLRLQRALCSWLLKSATAAGFVIGISESYYFFLSILDTDITRFSTPRLHPLNHQPAAASRCNYVVARKSWIKDGHEC